MKPHYIKGQIDTAAGTIEQVSTVWTIDDDVKFHCRKYGEEFKIEKKMKNI